MTKINDETHPVEVGVADAFYIDEAVADPVLGSGKQNTVQRVESVQYFQNKPMYILYRGYYTNMCGYRLK